VNGRDASRGPANTAGQAGSGTLAFHEVHEALAEPMAHLDSGTLPALAVGAVVTGRRDLSPPDGAVRLAAGGGRWLCFSIT